MSQPDVPGREFMDRTDAMRRAFSTALVHAFAALARHEPNPTAFLDSTRDEALKLLEMESYFEPEEDRDIARRQTEASRNALRYIFTMAKNEADRLTAGRA